MRIEPFEPKHLVGAVAHPKQGQHQKLLESETIATVGMNWSAIADGRLIGVGGQVRIDDETGVWVLFTDRITPGRFIAVYRELARRLAGLLDSGEVVLIHIDPDYPEATRLAKKLGFREDGDEIFEGRRLIRMVAYA